LVMMDSMVGGKLLTGPLGWEVVDAVLKQLSDLSPLEETYKRDAINDVRVMAIAVWRYLMRKEPNVFITPGAMQTAYEILYDYELHSYADEVIKELAFFADEAETRRLWKGQYPEAKANFNDEMFLKFLEKVKESNGQDLYAITALKHFIALNPERYAVFEVSEEKFGTDSSFGVLLKAIWFPHSGEELLEIGLLGHFLEVNTEDYGGNYEVLSLVMSRMNSLKEEILPAVSYINTFRRLLHEGRIPNLFRFTDQQGSRKKVPAMVDKSLMRKMVRAKIGVRDTFVNVELRKLLTGLIEKQQKNNIDVDWLDLDELFKGDELLTYVLKHGNDKRQWLLFLKQYAQGGKIQIEDETFHLELFFDADNMFTENALKVLLETYFTDGDEIRDHYEAGYNIQPQTLPPK